MAQINRQIKTNAKEALELAQEDTGKSESSNRQLLMERLAVTGTSFNDINGVGHQ